MTDIASGQADLLGGKMRPLRLTREIIADIELLASLDASSIARLWDMLRKSLRLKLLIDQEVTRIVNDCKALNHLSVEDREQLSSAIVGVHVLKNSTNKNTADLVNEIIANTALESDVISSSLENQENLRLNLLGILSLDVIGGSVKALDLLSDQDKVYLQGKIISDIRPIFRDNINSPMIGSVVVHTIRIAYRSDRESQNIYISLDSIDLRELKDVIDRAMEKEASIINNYKLDSSGMFGTMLSFDGEVGSS